MFNLMLRLFVRYIVVNSLCSFLFCGGGSVAATGDGSNFVKISYWVFVILAPGHQGSHLKCMLFSGGYFFCEFPVCVLLRLSARVLVSGAGFWTGWTCLLCEKLRPQDWAKWAQGPEKPAAALCLSGDLMGMSARFRHCSRRLETVGV